MSKIMDWVLSQMHLVDMDELTLNEKVNATETKMENSLPYTILNLLVYIYSDNIMFIQNKNDF